MSSPSKHYDITYKVLVVGEMSVGKTSLIRKYSRPDEKMTMAYITTVGEYCKLGQLVSNLKGCNGNNTIVDSESVVICKTQSRRSGNNIGSILISYLVLAVTTLHLHHEGISLRTHKVDNKFSHLLPS